MFDVFKCWPFTGICMYKKLLISEPRKLVLKYNDYDSDSDDNDNNKGI